MSQPARDPDIESGIASPTIVDSRRLMGPNLLHAGPGAVLDVSLDDATPAHNTRLLTAWHERASAIADALDWPDPQTAQRTHNGGASLFVTAPIDQLMTATEVTESAWQFADAYVAGSDIDDDLSALLAFSHAEMRRTPSGRRPLCELWNEAQRLGLNVTFDEKEIFVGTGAGAEGWPLDAVPLVEDINWLAIRDIPLVLVTGSNGKTTVVRMVAAMARAAGHTVGYTCTDGVWIGDTQVETGDYSGPAGARRVLQDTSVTLAVLETARGGMLRRGLAVQHASAAAIVTLSADHFGSYGIADLAALADVKMIVGRAVHERGTLIYNADVPDLVSAASRQGGRTIGVSQTPQSAPSGTQDSTAQLAEIPATLCGAAKHNVLNAAVALAIAHELELGPKATAALLHFGADPNDNMGRLMLKAFGGITVVIDYAHNPQSVAALIDATAQLPAARRAITLGTGGDRDDVALRAIAKAAVDSGAIDLYIAKEMPKFLRGREPGSISAVLHDALEEYGVPAVRRVRAPDDISAVRLALRWAERGDVLLLTVHDQRDAVLALVDTLVRHDWQAGNPLPA